MYCVRFMCKTIHKVRKQRHWVKVWFNHATQIHLRRRKCCLCPFFSMGHEVSKSAISERATKLVSRVLSATQPNWIQTTLATERRKQAYRLDWIKIKDRGQLFRSSIHKFLMFLFVTVSITSATAHQNEFRGFITQARKGRIPDDLLGKDFHTGRDFEIPNDAPYARRTGKLSVVHMHVVRHCRFMETNRHRSPRKGNFVPPVQKGHWCIFLQDLLQY